MGKRRLRKVTSPSHGFIAINRKVLECRLDLVCLTPRWARQEDGGETRRDPVFPCQRGERDAVQFAPVQDPPGTPARVQQAEEGSARWNRRPGSAMRANPGRKGLHGHQFFNKKYFSLIG